MSERRDRIDSGSVGHVSSDAAYAEVRDVMLYGGQEISNAVAQTIASWWQTPGSIGLAFTALSTTGRVSAEALLRDISDAFDQLDRERKRHGRDWDALGCLATWAINHPSRKR